MNNKKIVLPGGAGLVGQNLVARLREQGYEQIVVLDKHRANLAILHQMQPDITIDYADLAGPGDWCRHFHGAAIVVMLQAQIGGNDRQNFVRNNIDATRNILQCIKDNAVPQLIHISSSVVESVADDLYTNTKKAQEKLILESGIDCPIFRPTLMFGWYDRKHLGWLSRFMKKVPVFPIPGHGRYVRQPLFVRDFCDIIISCIAGRVVNGIYTIAGQEKIDYIDLIRAVKKSTDADTAIVRIPYSLFYWLLWLWERFDSNPPFTTQQLQALIARDEFEIINWPAIFGVHPTPLAQAIDMTFNDARHSSVILDF